MYERMLLVYFSKQGGELLAASYSITRRRGTCGRHGKKGRKPDLTSPQIPERLNK
jgi:hypothetical protein